MCSLASLSMRPSGAWQAWLEIGQPLSFARLRRRMIDAPNPSRVGDAFQDRADNDWF